MENHLKEALEIVKAQACTRAMTEEEITGMLKKLSENIRAISEGSGRSEAIAEEIGAIDPQKAIKEKSITCVICGKSAKMLSKKHLASHGLTPDEYREHCGYKKGTPLTSKALRSVRRKKMREMRLWERRGTKK